MPKDYTKVDATSFFESITLKKTPEELENMQKGAKFLDYSFKKLIDEVEEIIDADDSVKMSEISTKIKNSLDTENIKGLEGLDLANLDYNLPVCIQSGGNFKYDPATESADKVLTDDTIWLSMCCEYAEVCASAARTLKINPTKEEKEDYMLLRKAFAGLFASIKLGKKVSDCYNEVHAMLAKEKSEEWLKQHLGHNFGYGIGFKYQENSLEITPHNDVVLEENMVIFIRLYFKDLEYRNKSGYGIIIGDTIVLTKAGCKNLTKGIRKNYEDISYVINDDEEEEEEEEAKNSILNDIGIDSSNVINSSRRKAAQNGEKRNEIKRKEHQDELLNIKLAELNERIARNEIVIASAKQKAKNMGEIKSYRNPKELPQGIPLRKIFLDEKRDTLLLPVGKKNFVPIHLALVKSISLTGEGEASYLRINLHTPGALNINQSMTFPTLKAPNGTFLRELTFKSNDQKHLQATCKKIREHMKKMKQLEREKEQNISLAKQAQIIPNKGKRVVMDNLVIRPNLTARKTVGALEAHLNGLRYTSTQNEKIDISYNNVKHCFFQPCDDELIVLVHFNLHNNILIGNKKVSNVQFYQEAGSLADDLETSKRKRTMHMNEQEELEQEQRERELRVKLNARFNRFVNNISSLASQNKYVLEFDIPYSDLAFYGAPNKGIVKLMPTVNCLVNLTEFPFFVITLDDIEIVHFERVQFSIKNFDMVFVYKDFHTTRRICSIPRESLDNIKDWLDQVDILFSEGVMSLNWNPVLAEIRHDFNRFLEEGGWAFLRDDKSDNGEEDSEGDSAFSASLKPDEESSEAEITEEENDEEEEDFTSEYSEEEVSDALDWEEQERQAAEADKRQAQKHVQAMQKVVSKL